MHHALLSLMLMAGACGEAPANERFNQPPAVVETCELPSVLVDLFVHRTLSPEKSRGAEHNSAECQAM